MMLLEMNESDTKYWFKTDNGLKRWIIIGLVFDISPPWHECSPGYFVLVTLKLM